MVIEASLSLGIVGHEGMITFPPDNACLHQVVDKHGRTFVLLQLVLSYIECSLLSFELGFDFVEPCYLGAEYIVLLELGLIGLSDLSLGSSPLGTGLEHVYSSSVEYAGLGGGMECSSNLGIHLYRESTINDQLLVPFLDLLLHPVGEDLLEN